MIGRPDERPLAVVVLGQAAIDGGLEVDQRRKYAALQSPSRQLGKNPSTALLRLPCRPGMEQRITDRFSVWATLSSARMKPSVIIAIIIIGKRQSQRSPTQPFGSSRVTLH